MKNAGDSKYDSLFELQLYFDLHKQHDLVSMHSGIMLQRVGSISRHITPFCVTGANINISRHWRRGAGGVGVGKRGFGG